jgi:hypothetical protein
MKQRILSVVVFFLSVTGSVFAQSVAQDWTKSDCSGKTHHLFDELDNGKVVLMQFDMMNCTYCTAAAYNTDQIIKDFQVSNPGRVVMYSMGYNNATTCDLMKSWVSTNKFSFDIIEKCPEDVTYYGGMGMPTIVVTGGWDHKVYYNKLGFNTSDNASIKAAINAALLKAGIDEPKTDLSEFALFPNPAGIQARLSYTVGSGQMVQIDLFDMLGNKVRNIANEVQAAGLHTAEIYTSGLSNGMYIVRINGNRLKLQVAN